MSFAKGLGPWNNPPTDEVAVYKGWTFFSSSTTTSYFGTPAEVGLAFGYYSRTGKLFVGIYTVGIPFYFYSSYGAGIYTGTVGMTFFTALLTPEDAAVDGAV
jgi:hypothetical protein